MHLTVEFEAGQDGDVGVFLRVPNLRQFLSDQVQVLRGIKQEENIAVYPPPPLPQLATAIMIRLHSIT